MTRLAETLVRDVLLAVGVRANAADLAVAIHNANAELQEVREVLEALAVRRHIDHVTLCWCKKRWDGLKPHEPACQRARELTAKLDPNHSPQPKIYRR